MKNHEIKDSIHHEILVICETPAELEFLEGILTHHGYEVRSASSGRLALQSVADKKPDLILLDMKLPDLDTYEVCRRFKLNKKTRDIPILFLGEPDETTDEVKGFNSGGSDYITKPFDSEEVLERIRTHLHLRELAEYMELGVHTETQNLTNEKQKRQKRVAGHKRTERTLKEQNERLAILNRVAQVTLGSLDIEEMCDNLLFVIRAIMPCDAFLVDRYYREENTTRGIAAYDTFEGNLSACEVADTKVAILPGGQIFQTVIKGRKPLLIHRSDAKKESKDYTYFGDTTRPSASLLWAPMVVGDRVVGIVSVQSYTPQAYSERDVSLISAIAQQTGPALEALLLSAQLRESEEKWRLLYENLPGGSFVVNKDYVIEDVNDLLCTVTGYSREELIGQLCDIICPKGPHKCPIFDFGKERINNDETAVKRRDGILVPIIKSARRLSFGRKEVIVESFQDITERKRAEELLKESEERFKQVADNAQEWIWEANTEGLYTYASPVVEKILGYKPEEIVGQKYFYDLFYPEDREILKKAAFEVFALKQSFREFPNRNIHKNGKEIWLSTSGIPLLSDDGTLLGYRGADTDITERRRAEEAIQASEEKYRTLFETSRDAVLLETLDGRVIDCNEMAYTMYGYSKEEFIGVPLACRISDDQALSIPEILTEEKTTYGQFVERTAKRKNGELFPVEVSTILIDIEGEKRILVHIRDISDRKKTLDALRESEERMRQGQKMEAIGRLAGGIAHDFNNLLQAIQGYTDITIRQIPSEGPAYGYLGEVIKAVERASSLVRQLLAFSRREAIQRKYLDLSELVGNVLKMLQRVIGEHIELKTSHAPGLKNVYADRGQMEQILMNLCVNARDALPNGGCVSIQTENYIVDQAFVAKRPWASTGDYVRLSVSDNGIGMSPEVVEHIFEPFYTTKEFGQGTGLGLATVYGIVKQHDGMIEVDSKPGEGTTFRIYFQSVETQEGEAEAFTDKEIPSGNGEILLLAEDDELVRNLTEDVLKNAGYQLIVACDGEEAIDLFEKHSQEVALALLDVMMPKKNGRQVCEVLRKHRPNLPVLFASGYSIEHLENNLEEQNYTKLILKPFSSDELLREVHDLLSAREK